MSFAKIAFVGGAMLVASAAALACSSDDDATPGGGTADGGVTNDGGGGQTNPDGTFTCTAKAATPVGALPNRSVNGMAQNDTTLFAVDLGSGVSKGSNLFTGAIVKLPKSGGEVSPLYAPATAGFGLLGLLVSGDDIFTTETSDDDTIPHSLLHISASTGTRTVVATRPGTQDGFGELVALDDASVYYFHGDSLYRQGRAVGSGAPVEIASTGFLLARIVGDDIYLSSGLATAEVWKVPRSAASKAEAKKLTDKSGCFGTIVPTAAGDYYCGSTDSLYRINADFTVGETIWKASDELDGPTARLPRIVGIDGNKAFFSIGNAETFRTFDIGQTSSTILGCGADGVLEGTVDANAVYVRLLPKNENDPWPVVKIAR